MILQMLISSDFMVVFYTLSYFGTFAQIFIILMYLHLVCLYIYGVFNIFGVFYLILCLIVERIIIYFACEWNAIQAEWKFWKTTSYIATSKGESF